MSGSSSYCQMALSVQYWYQSSARRKPLMKKDKGTPLSNQSV
jgi:hypothetical protein